MKLATLLVAVAVAASTATADPKPAKPQEPPAPAIENTFGFDWLKIKSSKCSKVTGALLKKLGTSYRCSTPPPVGTASGKVQVAVCTAKKGKSEILLFGSADDCNAERDTQLANGG